MKYSDEFLKALKISAFGFTREVVTEEYELEEELDRKYKKQKDNVNTIADESKAENEKIDTKTKTAKKKSSKQESFFEDLGQNFSSLIRGEISSPQVNGKYRLVCTKCKVQKEFVPPDTSALRLMLEVEKEDSGSDDGISELVRDIKSLTNAELIELRRALLLEEDKNDDDDRN